MGKVDDMRRRREAQHRAAAPTDTDATPSDEPAAVAAAEAEAEPTSGVCAECGKVKAVQRGLVVSHQRGLGKFCPGSRKPPG